MDRTGNNRRVVEDESSSGPDVSNEVNKLIKENFRNGNIPPSTIRELRNQYKDDKLIDQIQDAYYEKMTNIRRRAMKFTKLIEKKYGQMGYPLHIVLHKALKYKKKYNLSEPEFEIFRQVYQKNLNTRNKGEFKILAPNTNMAKVFGDPHGEDKLVSTDAELRYVKQIIGLYNEHRPIHAQIVVQSLSYQDLALQAVAPQTKFDPKMQNGASYIHPVIAAMFLPKIQKFDEYFLFSNLAFIVKAKQDKEPLVTYHNYILLYNLVTEPTDVVCSGESPLADILNRVMLQFNLWKNVLRLRQGNYYDSAMSMAASDFMNTIDYCRINNYDAPDLLMIGDESVILRRLINAFAFRSIVVVTTPFMSLGGISNVNLPIVATQVIKVPMLNIRLPVFPVNNQANLGLGVNYIKVSDSLNTTEIVYNNGRFEPRIQSVVHADEVIIFNIPRRTYQPLVNMEKMFQPQNFTNMPKHALGMEKINDVNIEIDNFIKLNDSDYFDLRSAVVLNTRTDTVTQGTQNKLEYIYSSKAVLFEKPAAAAGRVQQPIRTAKYVYDPDVIFREVYDGVGVGAAAAALDAQTKYGLPIRTFVDGQVKYNNADAPQIPLDSIEQINKKCVVLIYVKDRQ